MTQNQLPANRFPSLSSLLGYFGNQVYYFENDNTMPYALHDGLWHYFVQDKDKYFVLGMTSLKELGENRND